MHPRDELGRVVINGLSTWPMIGSFHPECFIGDGMFRPNGSSDPVLSECQGSLVGLFTPTHSATGDWLITMDSHFKFPVAPVIVVGRVCKDMTTNLFQALQLGAYDNTNHRFHIGATQDDAVSGVPAAFNVPHDADNWITFHMFIRSSSAKR